MTTSTGANASNTRMIVDLLGKGYAVSDVARILEVTPSAVSQVATAHAIEIDNISADYRMAAVAQDMALDEIEGMLVEKLKALAAIETDSTKVLKMFQTINISKRRSRGEGSAQPVHSTNITQNVVHLTLPAHVANKAVEYIVNPNNEVVQVAGRNIITATNKQVAEQMQAFVAKNRAEAIQDLRNTAIDSKYLPRGIAHECP